MGCYKSIENCCSNLAEIPAQILVITAVGHCYAGRHLNKQFMNSQSLRAKCDKLLNRQTAEVSQFICFRDAGRNVISAEYR